MDRNEQARIVAAETVSVLSAVGETRTFAYEYDFGDRWEHRVVVEETRRMPIGFPSHKRRWRWISHGHTDTKSPALTSISPSRSSETASRSNRGADG